MSVFGTVYYALLGIFLLALLFLCALLLIAMIRLTSGTESEEHNER